MKYCNTCGATIRDKTRKCPNCKTKFNKKIDYDATFNSDKSYDDFSTHQINPSKQKAQTEKLQDIHIPFKTSKGVAMALSVIPPGLGLIYAGNRKKGLKILISFLIVVTFDVVTKVAFQLYAIAIPFTIIGYLTTIIWSIVSTKNHFKNYSTPSAKYAKQI